MPCGLTPASSRGSPFHSLGFIKDITVFKGDFVLIVIGLSVLVGYAVYVVVRVVRADFYSGTQKTVQCLLVLLLPLFGAALVHWFLRLQDSKTEKPDRAFIPQREPNIDDLRGLH
jgi:hypothetical protein